MVEAWKKVVAGLWRGEVFFFFCFFSPLMSSTIFFFIDCILRVQVVFVSHPNSPFLSSFPYFFVKPCVHIGFRVCSTNFIFCFAISLSAFAPTRQLSWINLNHARYVTCSDEHLLLPGPTFKSRVKTGSCLTVRVPTCQGLRQCTPEPEAHVPISMHSNHWVPHTL